MSDNDTPRRFPIFLRGRPKTDLRVQCAALCWRLRQKKLEILLVTSRETNRWGLPKGWPMDGRTIYEAAAQEAWEEAGVTGTISPQSVGTYSYIKPVEGKANNCLALVFALRVKTMHRSWPEKGQRQRRWMPAKKAARLVDGRDLKQVILAFNPR